MTALDLIAAAQEMPHTHKVVTTYADGAIREFTTRHLESAKTYAIGERRKIGKDLVSSETGEKVRVVSVDIVAM